MFVSTFLAIYDKKTLILKLSLGSQQYLAYILFDAKQLFKKNYFKQL